MTREEIRTQLNERHRQFAGFVSGLSDADYLYAPEGKWTAAQQMEHIYLSVKPLGMLRLLPGFMLKRKFGTANRPSRSYDEVVARYRRKLEEGGIAPERFKPRPVTLAEKARIEKNMLRSVKKLDRALQRYSEAQLDLYILPHPLLGKLTLREMMYFTMYHVQHHEAITLRNLESRSSV